MWIKLPGLRGTDLTVHPSAMSHGSEGVESSLEGEREKEGVVDCGFLVVVLGDDFGLVRKESSEDLAVVDFLWGVGLLLGDLVGVLAMIDGGDLAWRLVRVDVDCNGVKLLVFV
jgi:hypothetical protein